MFKLFCKKGFIYELYLLNLIIGKASFRKSLKEGVGFLDI